MRQLEATTNQVFDFLKLISFGMLIKSSSYFGKVFCSKWTPSSHPIFNVRRVCKLPTVFPTFCSFSCFDIENVQLFVYIRSYKTQYATSLWIKRQRLQLCLIRCIDIRKHVSDFQRSKNNYVKTVPNYMITIYRYVLYIMRKCRYRKY